MKSTGQAGKIQGGAAPLGILMNPQKAYNLWRKGINSDVITRAAPVLVGEDPFYLLVSSRATPWPAAPRLEPEDFPSFCFSAPAPSQNRFQGPGPAQVYIQGLEEIIISNILPSPKLSRSNIVDISFRKIKHYPW